MITGCNGLIHTQYILLTNKLNYKPKTMFRNVPNFLDSTYCGLRGGGPYSKLIEMGTEGAHKGRGTLKDETVILHDVLVCQSNPSCGEDG